jgi:glutathione S-transferase
MGASNGGVLKHGVMTLERRARGRWMDGWMDGLTIMRACGGWPLRFEDPDLYAKETHKNKKEFDCVQRAHQNTLENFPAVAVMAIVNGVVFPIATAATLVAWNVGRILYIRGYASGAPEKRQLGGLISHLADLPLFFMCFATAKKMLEN